MSANTIYDEVFLFMCNLGVSDVLIKKILSQNIGTSHFSTVDLAYDFETM